MDRCVFVHTNHKQYVGALVSAYSMKRNADDADAFDVRIIQHKDHPFFARHEGEEYLRDGVKWTWLNEDLQSFTPLRFMPPELMGYKGRAVVVDPDIFAVADVSELLTRDMNGKAILCRTRPGAKSFVAGRYASSVMVLDCARLEHWRTEEQFDQLFALERDYRRWINLDYEDPKSIGMLEPVWNDFDRLTPDTKMLHNTRRKTQPWKSGLPVDWRPAERFRLFPPIGWLMTARRKLFGDYAFMGNYAAHPDRNQENLFFGLLRECVEKGIVTEAMLRDEMEQNHIRHDAIEIMEKAPPLQKAA